MSTIQRSFCAPTMCFTADSSVGGWGSICLGSYGGEGAHVQIGWDVSGGTAASLRVGVFGSADMTLIDTVPLTSFDITPVVSTQVVSSFVLRDIYWCAISAKSVGGVSGGDITVSYVAWEWSSS